MMQKLISTLSLFLALGANSCDAFSTSSMTRREVFPIRTKVPLWSSSETSVLGESSSEELGTDGDSSQNGEEIFSTGNGEKNDDPDIDAMMSEGSSDEQEEEENLMQQIKDSGTAGVISYAAWELAFWTVSVPVCVLGYKQVTGHWPDFQDKDDLSKLGAEAFAFVNFARFAVPLRIGLALGTTPWVQENIVDVFLVKKESDDNSVAVDEVTAESEDGAEDKDIESSDDGENKKASRFRIRSRVGNLVNRVFRRQKQDQDVEE